MTRKNPFLTQWIKNGAAQNGFNNRTFGNEAWQIGTKIKGENLEIPDANTVGLWQFNEAIGSTSFQDLSVNENTATAQGDGKTVAGPIGWGNVLDCSNSPIAYASAPQIDAYDDMLAGEFTVEGRGKINGSTGTTQMLVSRDLNTRRIFSIDIPPTSISATGISGIRMNLYGSPIRSEGVTVPEIPFGDWFYFALERVGDTFNLYLNSTKAALILPDYAFTLTGAVVNVGFGFNHYPSFPQYLNGQLDNVKFSNIARFGGSLTPPTESFL